MHSSQNHISFAPRYTKQQRSECDALNYFGYIIQTSVCSKYQGIECTPRKSKWTELGAMAIMHIRAGPQHKYRLGPLV